MESALYLIRQGSQALSVEPSRSREALMSTALQRWSVETVAQTNACYSVRVSLRCWDHIVMRATRRSLDVPEMCKASKRNMPRP